MTTDQNQGRGRTEARADELIGFGRDLFESEGLFAPETKLRKIVRTGLRTYGYERTKAEIVRLFATRVGYDLETYERALRTSSIKNIAHVGEKKPGPPARLNQNPITTTRN